MFLPYPITVPRLRRGLPKQYHPSAEPTIRLKLQDYLNERAKNSAEVVLDRLDIAHDTGIDVEVVKLFLRRMTGHTAGITVGNPELEE